jgi:hypothetical protein
MTVASSVYEHDHDITISTHCADGSCSQKLICTQRMEACATMKVASQL